MQSAMIELRQHLLHEPADRHVRAMIGDRTVVDSTNALLVWEPRRVAPSYGIPVADLAAELTTGRTVAGDEAAGQPVLHPGIPFDRHSTPGQVIDVHVGDLIRPGAGFRPADPDLAAYVVLDFSAFTWFDEDEELVAHLRDPYHRVEVRRTSRPVRVELDGTVLAESDRARMLFETSLPTRFYLPREDVLVPLLPSDRQTMCAYKGRASYWSVEAGGRLRRDLAWSYPHPLAGMEAVTDLVAFFDERVDVVVGDGPRGRPRTMFTEALLEEIGLEH
jgi:uncharacterized protein (DUF427 family)